MLKSLAANARSFLLAGPRHPKNHLQIQRVRGGDGGHHRERKIALSRENAPMCKVRAPCTYMLDTRFRRDLACSPRATTVWLGSHLGDHDLHSIHIGLLGP